MSLLFQSMLNSFSEISNLWTTLKVCKYFYVSSFEQKFFGEALFMPKPMNFMYVSFSIL